MRQLLIVSLVALSFFATGCTARQHPATGAGIAATGEASYYAARFQGRPTASGEPFDNGRLTAAHRTLPFDTKVRVTNLANGRSVVVRVNDRGPFARGRIIDLSQAAARRLDMLRAGVTRVRVEPVGATGRGTVASAG
jgi:rare lipoprotein A